MLIGLLLSMLNRLITLCKLLLKGKGSPIICALMQEVLRHAKLVFLYQHMLTKDFVASLPLQTIIPSKLGIVRQL